METWQFWLITITSLLLAFTLITVGVYLAMTVRVVKKTLTSLERHIVDLAPIFNLFAGVEEARKQAQQSEKQTLNNSWSFEAGKLATDWALTSLALWNTLFKRRKL